MTTEIHIMYTCFHVTLTKPLGISWNKPLGIVSSGMREAIIRLLNWFIYNNRFFSKIVANLRWKSQPSNQGLAREGYIGQESSTSGHVAPCGRSKKMLINAHLVGLWKARLVSRHNMISASSRRSRNGPSAFYGGRRNFRNLRPPKKGRWQFRTGHCLAFLLSWFIIKS